MEKTEFDRAAATLRRVLRAVPQDGEIAFRLGTALEQAGEVDSALAVFDRLLRQEPGNALVLNYVGYLCIDRGIRLEEAVAQVQRAVEIDPENGAYLDSYGWGLHRLDRTEEAVEVLRQAVARSPREPVIHLHLGQALEALGRTDEARKAYRKAADLNPKDEEARRLLRDLKGGGRAQPGK
jgi:Flp pilus assembly protein TadD